MSRDFYIDAAAQRANEIDADRSQALADLAQAKRYGDHSAAAQAVQTIADLDAARQNLELLHSRYVQSQNPPPPRELTLEERLAKSPEEMTWQDGLEIAKAGSRYGAHLQISDEAVQRGIRDVINRRQRGGQ